MKRSGAKKIDMLNGSIWNKLPLFALPVAATAILEQLFNASDLAVVGNFAGDKSTAAVAAVGANGPVIGLIVNFLIGISLGANVVIANAMGRNNKESVQRAVHTSIIFALVGGTVVAVIAEFFVGRMLSSLNVPDDVLPLAVIYFRIYLIGLPVILLYNFEAAIFRSIGDTKVPLIALAVSGVLNVILNLFFVIVLKMTVSGVATATVISNAVSSIILFVRLVKSDKYIKIEPKKMRFSWNSFRVIMKIGLPAGIQSAVFSISNIVIQSAINSLGTVVIAASSAAFNVEILAYDVLNSFSQACTTFVGQNYGAGQIKRCKKTMQLSFLEGAIATFVSVVVLLLSARSLLAIFNSDPEVIEIGYTRLIYLFSAYVFSMLYEVLSGYMRGFGISLAPALLTMLGVCGIRIAWVKFVFPTSMTFQTVMWVYPISLGATAVLILCAVLIYRPSKHFAGLETEEEDK